MVRRITQGFEIDEETLALDLINRVGPGGEYLTSDHTLRHFKENWFPDLISRKPFEKWVAEGEKSLGLRANERARSILQNHMPRPLERDIQKKLREIISSRDK